MDIIDILYKLTEELNIDEKEAKWVPDPTISKLKWTSGITNDDSLKMAFGLTKIENMMDVKDEEIKKAIQNRGTKFKQKLVGYANTIGTYKGQKYKNEHDRILNIVKNTNTPKGEGLDMDINNVLDKLNEELGINEEEDVEDVDVENPGLLEVPKGKEVNELPLSHFKDLVEKKGYEEIIRGLQNIRRWHKNDDPKLSDWADDMMDKLKSWVDKQREDDPDFAK